MKIIKAGNLDKIKEIKTFECYHCGCVFEADRGEYSIDVQYNWSYCFCECPTCKQNAYEKRLKDK